MWKWTGALIAAVLLVAGCSSGGGSEAPTSPACDAACVSSIQADFTPADSAPVDTEPAPDPATDQTTDDVSPLDDTKNATCQTWLDATQEQRDVAAQRFVRQLHAADQSDVFAHSFALDISTDCEAGPTLMLPEVVGALATLDTDDFPR